MEIILYDDVLPKLVCFSLSNPTLLKSYVFCFYSFQKIETIRPHVCMYTLHSDEVVSLISGDESVVYSCSQMQWMLHYTAIPAIIITSKEPVCPRVELILKIIIILLIIFLGFIKSKPC